MRRLLPAAVVVLMVLGFLRWEGARQGLFGTTVGILLLTLAAIGLIGGLLGHVAGWLDRSEAARRAVEGELRDSSRFYASAREITRRRAAAGALEASVRQTRQILETAHDAFIAIDERGVITDCNPSAQATFGWGREEMLGAELAELIIPEAYREAHRRGIAHFLDSGEGPVLGKRLELAALHRDGREFPIELTISAVQTEAGHAFNAFLRDVTERKAAEETRGRFAAVVESSGDAIVVKTLEGVIQSWNRGAHELFGYTVEEAIGQPIAMLVPPRRRDELAAILAQLKRGEDVGPLETVRVTKGGREVEVSLRISLVYDAAGEVIGASAITRDITERKLAEAQLRHGSRHFELARDLAVTTGVDGHFKTVNPAVTRVLGWSPEEFLSRPFIEMVHPEDRAATLAQVTKLVDGRSTFLRFVNRCEARDGSFRWLDWNAIVPPDEELMYASARDVTERTLMEQALREAEERFRAAFDGAPIGVCLMSLDRADPGRLLQANAAMAEMLGTCVEDLVGSPVSSLTHPEDHPGISAGLTELIDGGASQIGLEKRFMHRNGHPVWTLISAARLPGRPGQPDLAVTHVMDISDRKQFEGQLQHLADHDALTGLFNRRRFTEELERALKVAKRFHEQGAVLFVDLDGFKFVNDSLGHAAGDELIGRSASLLVSTLRETDTLARVGGDEFALLLARTDQAAAVRVAEKLLLTLRAGTSAIGDDRSPRVSCSIGIALFSGGDDLTADELLVEADIAMYDAKEAGKDCHAIYQRTEGRRELMSVRENWNARLRTALERDRFVLLAQPIMPICSHGTTTFELLLRLPDDHGDLIPPGTFLYNAERFGLIERIDRWVIRHAVRHLSASHAAGIDLMLTVNVSGKTMDDRGLPGYVATLLAEYPVRSRRLVIEITETAAITNIQRARTLATDLQTLGCQIALDDFGAGFASFHYLKHLKFDYLKIDGEFITNLCATPTDQLLVKTVVSIASGLAARTVAEYVGSDATVDLLHKLGVDYGQGYHLGKPASLNHSLPYLTGTTSAT